MLISMNWISDFVDLKGIDLKALINRFTLSTAEVEDIYELGTNISGVIAAKILEVNDHPDSKKLHILKVTDGTKDIQVVCGAPNVKVGMIVPFATEGANVGGQAISACPVAGVQSYGMCCSERELGISDEHGGLMELAADTKLGTPVNELFPMNDIVFEVDNKSLTNRPDLWGHYGIAREIAALTNRPLKPIDVDDTSLYASLPQADINIEDNEKCLRYSGIVIKNVTERISPITMRIRLFYCGMRSLGLLADLTNYLMLELGQPMHAFDYDVVNKINVRSFKEEFEFETLDNIKRKIPADTLMICSDNTPVAVAGIKGGLDSCITDGTTSILLESANFDGVAVRKASTALALRTDASARYEKVLDPELTVPAIGRFIKLLREVDGGATVASSLTDKYVRHYPEIKLTLSKAYIDKYTGIAIDNETVLNTLVSLGFDVTLSNDIFSVTVPSYRATKDVSIKADLIEEITRIYGYDNFEIKTNSTPLIPVRHSVEREAEYKAKQLLSDTLSFNEVHSYLWYNQKQNKELGIEVADNVKILNSVSPDTCMLRAYMAPSMLNFANVNKNSFAEFGIFEIGKVVKGLNKDGLCDERKILALLTASKLKSEKDVFYKAKSAVETLMINLKNIKPTYKAIQEDKILNWVHPYNSLEVYAGELKIGYISLLHPTIKSNLDKKLNIAVAELDFAAVAALDENPIEFMELSRFPIVDIDLSLALPKETPFKVLSDILDGYKDEYLLRFELQDIYEDTSMDIKSVTVRFYFGSKEKTLSGDEIEQSTKSVLAYLLEHNIKMR